MNIVYGVSGEGLGHVFEAREVAALLRRDGHAVKILTYGDRACRSLAEFQPTRIGGIEMFFTARGLSLNRTFWGNLRTFRFYLGGGRRRVLREIADFRPDVFITAYEPFTTLAAHRFHRPLISMDNQNELRHLPRPQAPTRSRSTWPGSTTRIVTWVRQPTSSRPSTGGPGGTPGSTWCLRSSRTRSGRSGRRSATTCSST